MIYTFVNAFPMLIVYPAWADPVIVITFNKLLRFPDIVLTFPDIVLTFPDIVLTFPDIVFIFPDIVLILVVLLFTSVLVIFPLINTFPEIVKFDKI